MSFSGKTAFITGSAQGLGEAFAIALLDRGAKVCLSDVNQQQGEITVCKLQSKYGDDNVIFVVSDVTNEDQFKETFRTAVEKFGKVDIMVNNAGIAHETLWEKTVDINLNGVIRGTYLALEHMRKDKGGQGGIILNIASIAGILAFPPCPVYGATKHAVVGFTRSWAANPDCEKLGVRFVTLCPSFVKTAFVENVTEDRVVSFDSLNSMVEEHGWLTVDEVAEQFIKLLEKENNNGAVLAVYPKGPVYMEY